MSPLSDYTPTAILCGMWQKLFVIHSGWPITVPNRKFIYIYRNKYDFKRCQKFLLDCELLGDFQEEDQEEAFLADTEKENNKEKGTKYDQII